MKTIYIDSDYKCHTAPADGRTAVETDAFNGKCKAYIESYRFVPAGCEWTREDGVVFSGEMVSPWKDDKTVQAAQSAYEESLAEMQDMQAALEMVGVTPTEEVTDDGQMA